LKDAQTRSTRLKGIRRATGAIEQSAQRDNRVALGPLSRDRAVVVFDARYRPARRLALSTGLQIFD
jgi:hypothetical protein